MIPSGTSRSAPRFFVSDIACEARRGHGGHLGCAYQVGWSINPHMRPGAVEPSLAKGQHERFVGALEEAGAIVHRLPFIHGAYDSVFAKDNAVLVRRGGRTHALLAAPRHAERRAEQRARRVALEASGVVVSAPPEVPIEGGDVVVRSDRRGAFLGHGFRSSPYAVSTLERFLEVPVVPLELRDPLLYHLDMVLAPLGDLVLVCEDALTPDARHALEAAVGPARIVDVPLEEARRFALNFVGVGQTVILASGAPTFERRLRGFGYEVRSVDLSQFHHAGGSAACLVSECHVQPGDAWTESDARREDAA